MLWTERDDNGAARLGGYRHCRNWQYLPDGVFRGPTTRVEKLPPERFLLLRWWWWRRLGLGLRDEWLLNVCRVDDEGRNRLHGRGLDGIRTANQPLPLLPLFPDLSLPFFVLPPPLLAGQGYVPFIFVVHDF